MRPAALHTNEIALPDLHTPVVARLAGALLVAAGLFGAASGVQVLALFEGALATLAALPVLAAGLAALLVAPFAYDGRGWAAILGTVLAAAIAVLALGWIAGSVLALAFAPTLFLAFFAASGALAVLPFAIGPSLRLSRLRRALAA
jgi:hypothetical protein